MSRTFKRPMFRKGGNVGVGIMSGITDRVQAQDGFAGEDFPTPSYSRQLTELQANKPIDTSVTPFTPTVYENIDIEEMVGTPKTTEEYIAELQKGAGKYGGADPLTTFLLTAGPQVAKATGFADAISKLGPANKALLERLDKEAQYQRDLRLAGTKLGIGAEERADQKTFDLKKLDLSQENQVKYLNDQRKYEQLTAENKLDYEEAVRDKTRAYQKLDNEDKQKFEQRLIDEGRAFELEKIKRREEFELSLIDKQKEALESFTTKDYIDTYEGNSVQAGNRAKYENDKIQTKMTEKFGSQNAGLAGGIHGDLEKKKKKKNIGKVYYDVDDGKFKRLRRDVEGEYSYEVIDIDTYEKPAPEVKDPKKVKEKKIKPDNPFSAFPGTEEAEKQKKERFKKQSESFSKLPGGSFDSYDIGE